ncbi:MULTISPECIES: elements of external origin [unclassified Lysobacter]|uniref:elements of external origin n=1 Tax=unclassified Lysobacter TaxID=2635362 RepID=UPI001BE7E1FD|nr:MULTISPECIES: elements of external origin [unclassified Lysobacter]MBT2748355.1 elements of external origin [Lysobacter sp. ISL-42]MBT2749878.1 elements of external origin [Lysobacter sp. ISL-50]MBT2781206.1 elements of external origin [Lysobacter sp. ISL-52]
MGISIRAYGRHRGVSDTAVRKAIAAGRITAETDGTINAARADAEWAASTRPPDGTQLARPSRARSSDDGAAMVSTGAPSGSNTYAQARTANEVLKAQHHKLRIAQLKGELIDRSQVMEQIFALARTERDAWLNWPARISSMLAAELGIDPHTMHVALEREVRQHLSELGEFSARLE